MQTPVSFEVQIYLSIFTKVVGLVNFATVVNILWHSKVVDLTEYSGGLRLVELGHSYRVS